MKSVQIETVAVTATLVVENQTTESKKQAQEENAKEREN